MRACADFILRCIAGESILMPVGDRIGTFRGTVLMNELSAFVWEQLQTPVSRGELLTRILDRYETDEKTAAADLDVLLAELKQMGIVEE